MLRDTVKEPELAVSETGWKCGICGLSLPDHKALIEHVVSHLGNLVKQYPYSVQEEIVRRLMEQILA